MMFTMPVDSVLPSLYERLIRESEMQSSRPQLIQESVAFKYSITHNLEGKARSSYVPD